MWELNIGTIADTYATTSINTYERVSIQMDNQLNNYVNSNRTILEQFNQQPSALAKSTDPFHIQPKILSSEWISTDSITENTRFIWNLKCNALPNSFRVQQRHPENQFQWSSQLWSIKTWYNVYIGSGYSMQQSTIRACPARRIWPNNKY